MCSDLGSASRCCLGYSAVGFIFTLFVGVMVTAQPFFITGLDYDKAPGSAFGAMGFFFFTFCASAYGVYHDNSQKMEESYAEGARAEGYQLNQDYGSRYD
eukprot:CAMPEP_0178964476 /NCGR_PEP_ID=MMETSP0789-20121207/15697_1 /TAXON_ID=3005 /ORGANISM="Rhizosolenia setigera, Strain CCMP 1694" /LENGTH=99 /DNA_ID=CAMNT_0020649253 /DNA_START=65 /DNA_END=364 /DNA_ORIENTATION=+